MALLARRPAPEVQFFCLQLLQDHVRLMSRHQELRKAVMSLVCGQLADLGPTFLVNRLAALLGDLILLDFPQGWPEAFSELLELAAKYPAAADLFLRISLVLNDAFDPCHTQKGPAELARDHRVKDAMRASAVPAIVSLLQQQLTRPDASLSLKALAGYADWIDVALVAEPGLLTKVYAHLQPGSNCNADALACIRAIIGKGMPSADRIRLAEYLSLAALIAPPSKPVESEGEVETVRLLAQYGRALALVNPPTMVEVEALIGLLPSLLGWLRVVSEDGLAELVPLILAYPQVLQMASKEHATALLAALIPRLRLQHSLEEEEPPRNRLLPAFDALCLLLSSTATAALRDHVLSVSEGRSLADQELALFLVQRYGETMKGQPSICITIHDAGGQARVELTAFGQMLQAVLAMRLPPSLSLARLEILAKYAMVIESSQRFDLAQIMGLFAESVSTSLRACELLGRWAMRSFKPTAEKTERKARHYAGSLGQLVALLQAQESQPYNQEATICRWEVIGQLLGLLEEGMPAALAWIRMEVEKGRLQPEHCLYALGSLLKGHADAGGVLTPALHAQAAELIRAGRQVNGHLFALQRLLALPTFAELDMLEPIAAIITEATSAEAEQIEEALTIINMASFRLRAQMEHLLMPRLSLLLQRLVEQCQRPAEGTDDAVRAHELRSKTIALITTLVTGGQAALLQAHAQAIQATLIALLKPVDWPLDKAIISTSARSLRDRLLAPELVMPIAFASFSLILAHDPNEPALQPVLVEWSHLAAQIDPAMLSRSLGLQPPVMQALQPILAMTEVKQRRAAIVDFFVHLRRHLGIVV